MKYAKQILALALTLLPALAAAQLQSGEEIVSQVPFEFISAECSKARCPSAAASRALPRVDRRFDRR